ncbi:TetR/AcrR family transcriptional regulator [Streptomyces sp. NRRL F-5126]|uniref:TetR/AcrR family transcriptional regulator n=1 Tax=Streptomyces sp. NRRL F-5126 TaxID=1463857 RepID=UPI00099DCFC9|nr:TetR/AcrR family transcriptional regulator [Streptomyces sp. NRRL F-5126]
METTTMSKRPDSRSPRERLLETANRLFYAEGIHTVGIDRILKEAGVAKASLYKTFGNKEGLVKAYLEGRHQRQVARIQAALDRAGSDPRERLLAIFDAQATLFAERDFRGCPFAAAAAEERTGGEIEVMAAGYRNYPREVLRELAEAAGATDPGTLARQLHLVYDGALHAARMDHDPEVAVLARATGAVLVDAALAH